MMTLISLVGEQPMPILLPGRFLKPDKHILVYTSRTRDVTQRLEGLLEHVSIVEVDPYALESTLTCLRNALAADEQVTVNLTGGTKMMALAAFALASERNADVVYFQSEGHTSQLHRFGFVEGGLHRRGTTEQLPELITIKDYLNAHLPGFRSEGFSKDREGALTAGGMFEEVVADELAEDFEIMAGIRPERVADQIEIDLVIRYLNQVGIAEVKLGDAHGKGPKKSIDQLSTAGSREYLGIYTKKFLIVGRRQSKQIKTLAHEKDVKVIELPGYESGRCLPENDYGQLLRVIYRELAGTRFTG